MLRITAGPDADETRIIGLELRRRGNEGSLVVTRGDAGLVASVTLSGTAITAVEGEPDACLVAIIDDADDTDANGADTGRDPIPMTAAGRPQGLLRYTLEASVCPIVVDILDQAVLVRGPSVCSIREANCEISPRGLWTPFSDRLPLLGARSDGIAAIAARAIADNGPALAARSPGAEERVLRDLARARREDVEECTHFAPGPASRFCEARMAAARAADLAARLGVYPGEGPPPLRERPLPPPPLNILPEESPFLSKRERL